MAILSFGIIIGAVVACGCIAGVLVAVALDMVVPP
jgi:hypothetical protein